MPIVPQVVDGDLLEQPVDVIVNAWNRNIIPWWLLLPQGVAGAIRRRAGLRPFVEVRAFGPIPLGKAVLTTAGNLPYRGIVHVAGIDMLWRASHRSIRDGVLSAMDIIDREACASVAFPVIGAGTGGIPETEALAVMKAALATRESRACVLIVRYRPAGGAS